MKFLFVLALVLPAAFAEITIGKPIPCDFGLTPSMPATSCKDILLVCPFAEDGTYWFMIAPEKIIFQAMCDMTNGGFMLIAKLPKGFMPKTRFSTLPGEIVSKPQTFKEILDSVTEFNDGFLTKVMSPRTPFPMIYKNRVWRLWESKAMPIRKVRLCMMKNGKIAKDLEFNAEGANTLTWFDFERLVKKDNSITSWVDLIDNFEGKPIFSFRALTTPHRDLAAFYKRKPISADTCSTRSGWFMGINNIPTLNAGLCNYEINTPGLHFLFSKGFTKATFNDSSKIEVADGVAILVQ